MSSLFDLTMATANATHVRYCYTQTLLSAIIQWLIRSINRYLDWLLLDVTVFGCHPLGLRRRTGRVL